MNDENEFSRAGDVLKSLFDRLLPENAEEYRHFFSGWEKIAGEKTAMHVIPRDIINNVLILETDHPIWSQQIRMRQEGLLKAIRGKYPDLEIKRIRVVVEKKRKSEIKMEKMKIPADVTKEFPVKEPEQICSEEQSFLNLLETMRRRGDS